MTTEEVLDRLAALGEFTSRPMFGEVPPEVLHDREVLLSWAREAIRAGMSSEDPAG
jgi:TfoX/Sxy family transcriptional regulator of competence genes